MKLIISSVSGQPIYQQIEDQIRAAVLNGELKAGEALPSLRTLAKDLRISVLTVTRAYNELAQEGIIENVQGKGSFVMDRGNERMHEQLTQQVHSNLSQALQAAQAAGMAQTDLHAMLDRIAAELYS
ncbi:GntR family transcriptional regulator [Bombiscardovia apis]|uniref:GntR family transcriptional regulator n=1 Tax=Bombiscardovia apis TaxID=2932182 RepID=A0ABM8BCX6_9BIFI|nr:GntR family transcriptional regulator [Bombiscardovia apis]BDR54747.1 GntR family transcriptional regulator [Bombiscardovia apis]